MHGANVLERLWLPELVKFIAALERAAWPSEVLLAKETVQVVRPRLL